MKCNHPSAANIFNRLTSLTVEEDSNRIENLCTESLAWCLLQSMDFQKAFFRLMNVHFVDCDIHTQRGFSAKKGDDDGDGDGVGKRGCFDLVLLSRDGTSLAIVIEVKVWSGFGKKQTLKYRKALEKHYKGFKHRILVSLTPFPEKHPDVDEHIQWGKVIAALKQVRLESFKLAYCQFAAFLDSRNLGYMKLDKLNHKILKQWHSIASVQTQWIHLLGMFANDKELKKLFKGHTDCPEFDCYDSRSYIGIWSPGKSPWVYAGFGVMPTGLGVLWVGLMVPGRHAAKAKKVPKQLTSRFNAATQFLNTKEDFSANQGLTAEDENTHFEFAQPITPAFDGQSEKILEWFKATIMDARAFVTKHCK